MPNDVEVLAQMRAGLCRVSRLAHADRQGAARWKELPAKARAYLKAIAELTRREARASPPLGPAASRRSSL